MIIPALKKTYRDQVVLDTPEWEFPDHGIVVLQGENGSGKSTLGKILAGIVKPDMKFSLLVNYRIGYMTQQPYGFLLSVKKNLLLNSDPSLSKKENSQKADALLSAMGLSESSKKNAARLSGGQTQRMALARLLMRQYDMIILDEPTSSMDPEMAKKAEDFILEYHKKTCCQILLITHRKEQAQRFSSLCKVLENGRFLD
ncbi:MAG: ATP-binding cassette domain-containing protein [Lachnospiraceae bacterium]|nr:ATP-binding cassette domain-containing protein [Lachnospiraceae bacterium]